MIRSHVISVLKSASSQVSLSNFKTFGISHIGKKTYISISNFYFLCQVQVAIRSSGGSKTSVSEGVEASVIYVRFKAAAGEVINPMFLVGH